MNLDNIKTLAIIGDTHSCKTNLAFYHLRQYKGKRDIYLLGYPKKIDNFKEVSCFQDIFRIKNAIIFIDELQKYIKVYDRKANIELMELISTFKHNNNTLIFSTQLSQFITRGVEAFIDVWNITRMQDIAVLKNGSKPKRIIQNAMTAQRNNWGLFLDNGQYLQYGECLDLMYNGVFSFPNQNIAKDWEIGNSEEKAEENLQKMELNSENELKIHITEKGEQKLIMNSLDIYDGEDKNE